MTQLDTSSAVARLLALAADGDLLDRWCRTLDHGQGEKPFDVAYRVLLSHARVEPGRTLEAVRHLTRSRQRTWSATELARLTRLQAHALLGTGRCREAAVQYREAYERFRRGRDRAEMGRTTIGWVDALALCSDPVEAQRIARLGRRHLPAHDRVARARLDSNLGNAWLVGGRLDRAAVHYQRALREFEASGRQWEAGGTAYNLGLLQLKRAQVAPARRNFERARQSLLEAKLEVPALYATYGLAAADLATGRWEEGIAAIVELRERFAKVQDERAVAQMHRDLATLFVSLGAAEAAEPESAAALEAYEKLGLDNDTAQIGLLHGRLLATTGWQQDALTHLERSRQHWVRSGSVRSRARAEMEIARVLLAQGHPRRALARIRQAQRILDRHDRQGEGALCRAVAAQAHLELGHGPLALRLAQRAHQDARRYPARLERPWVALIVAEALSLRGEARDALRWVRRAVDELEKVLLRFGSRHLRILVGGSRDRIYQRAVDLALEHGGRRGAALAVDLIAKARAPSLIEDLLHGDRAALQPEVRAAITRLRDEILQEMENDDEGVRHRALQGEVTRLERQLEHAPRRRPALVRQAWQRRGLHHWRPHLKRRQLVLYHKGIATWRAFVLGLDGEIRRVDLPDAEDALRRAWRPLRITLETAAYADRSRREAFLAKTLQTSLAELTRLRQALWDPLELEHLPAVLVPDGELHGVPLEALAVLAEHADPVTLAVSRLPHPALLRPDPPAGSGRAVLLHGPGGSTRREVLHARRALQAAGFEVQLGERRSDLEEQATRLRILHVAAHGSFHREGWLLSGLRLADGWMGFELLRRQQLRGALLYFASCESGLAQALPGSDLQGWMTAGLSAGARELVLTLWKVDDRAAASFSQLFYPAWARGTSTAAATGEARQALRAKLPHPYHWAPFMAVQ